MKIGLANKGKIHSRESVERQIQKILGRHFHSEEHKKRLSERMKGNKYGIGYKMSESQKLILSKVNKGHKRNVGRVFPKEFGVAISKRTKGNKNPAWKGGKDCYYQHIARKTIENNIGRKLNLNETVHHLDYNNKNNSLSNLYLFSNGGEHTKYHHFLRKTVKKLKRGNI